MRAPGLLPIDPASLQVRQAHIDGILRSPGPPRTSCCLMIKPLFRQSIREFPPMFLWTGGPCGQPEADRSLEFPTGLPKESLGLLTEDPNPRQEAQLCSSKARWTPAWRQGPYVDLVLPSRAAPCLLACVPDTEALRRRPPLQPPDRKLDFQAWHCARPSRSSVALCASRT